MGNKADEFTMGACNESFGGKMIFQAPKCSTKKSQSPEGAGPAVTELSPKKLIYEKIA